MICPNYKIKEVFDGFNEVVVALGGKPMTEEEFRSSELRNLRTGRDYSAMEAAYKMYHRNNGNMPDVAPNGKHSILFDSLLQHFDGDRKAAIKAKSNVYSDAFFNWFGDWTRLYGIVDDSVKHNIITPEGEINWEYFESLMDKYHNKQPDSMFAHGRYTLSTRPENHFSEEKNTLNHIKFVTQSMLNLLEGKYDMDLPFVSEARSSLKNQKDLMILAAMFHDVAKPYRHGDIHGWESADILRDVLGLNYDNRLAEWAVRHHMPMPFSHKADFNKSNPEALEVAKNIARDAKRVGIDANTAINAWVLINAADVINGRELSVEDNWAKKAAVNGPTRYGNDLSVKNVLSIELKEKVELLKWAFEQIKDEYFGDTVYNYNNQERFDYQAFPEGGREDKKLPYLNNTSNVSKVVDENGEPLVVYHGSDNYGFEEFDPSKADDKISIFTSSSKFIASTYTKHIPLHSEFLRLFLLKNGAIDLIKNKQFDKLLDLIRSLYDHRLNPNDLLEYDTAMMYDELKDNTLSEEDRYAILSEISRIEEIRKRHYRARIKDVKKLYGNTEKNIRIFDDLIESYSHFIDESLIFDGSPEDLTDSILNKSKVYCLFENIKNPLYVTNLENEFGAALYWNTLDFTVTDKEGNKIYLHKTRDISKWAKDNGYDGVIFESIVDHGGYSGDSKISPVTDQDILYATVHEGEDSYHGGDVYMSDVYISFSPNQLKHVKNLGTFSPNVNNIYLHINEDDVLKEIKYYIKDYIKNLFGYGHSYNEIKKKVLELEKQLGVLEVKVLKDKKLNFDKMHFDGSPISRRSKTSRILGTDVYSSIIVLVNGINRLFPKLKIQVKEDLRLNPGSAFYDSSTNTIHYSPIRNGNLKSVDVQDIVEECLHPLIACIAATDKQLFSKLLLQAKKDTGLVSYIKLAYKHKSQDVIEQEIVTQAVARIYANNTYGNLLSIDEFLRKEHNRRFTNILSTIREWVSKIKSIITGDKILVKNSDFSTVVSSLDSIVDILNTKGIEFAEVDNRYMIDNMWHVSPGTTSSSDKIRKSAENIRHRFGVLYKTYEKMPNKSASRQKLANEIFEMYGKIKRLDNFDAVTNAMEFAKVKLGLKDDSRDGVLQWLKKNEVNNFENVSPELIVDVMQNSIGFFKDLLTYFPPDSYMTEDAINTRNNILGSINGGIFLLWSKAVYAVSDRVIDLMVDRWFTGQDEDREGMKEVAKDWLHKNMMYGDISGASAFLQNYQYSENPIVKQIFHLILVAETKTGMELLPVSAKISKAYIKANKDFGKLNPSWLKIFMEFDKNGVPTGNFVRDINYGLYQKDLDEFINNLNDEFNDKYGHSYYIDEDGTFINSLTGGFADDEEWVGGVAPHIIEYKLRIEEFKCERSNRRYTYEYYKERMSEPYSGPDPSLTHLTGNFKHGLSPRTLSKYNRIQSNINYYMSLCYDKESGSSHPENLTDQDWIKLESFRKELETLSNPYKEDGTIKSGEDYQTAIEIRAWEKWIGEKLDTQVDVDKFEQEANEILNTRGIDAYNKFIKYNSRVSINPNLISLTLKSYGLSDVYAEAVHARLLRTSLLKLVQSKTGYTRDLSLQEENPQFWQECKSTDQIIEDHRVKRGKDFALMMENTFSDELIPYRDAYGNAYDLSGNIVPRDKEKGTPLMSYYDHMIYKYTSIILSSPTRTINGLYDRVHGGLYVFRGTDDQVKNQVMLLFTYRRVIHHEDGSTEIVRLPLSIFSMLTPKDEWFVNYRTGKSERSITNVPSGRFSTKYDTTFKYMSDPKDYDYNSPIAEQPKRDYYDNKEAFDKVKGSAKELYDILTETCKNTQLLYRLNGFLFNYRLPMINALSMALLSRLKSDGYRNVSRAIFDAITTIEENDENMRTSSLFPTNPDGTVATDIPLRFVKPLEDMSRLSTDISSMVILFAEMGLNYKNKQQINNQVKVIRYNMDKYVRDQLQRLSDEDYTTKENENSVDLFDNMTSIHLYGNAWHFKKESNKPYDRSTVAFLKAARLVQRYETNHMLGLNILSMLVGACDAGVKLFREVLNGKYARPSDMVKGFIRCIEHTPKAIANIGCPLANNKFTALMQLFRISKGTRATYEHMNWGRLHKVSAQLLMGGFSMLDYMMNGLLLMTHMSNVRFYEGDSDVKAGFYTLYELQLQFIKAGRSKSDATLKHLFLHVDLYNAFDFDSEEGVCHIKPLYELYVTDDIATQIRTKTMSRGALYNGMNPDNDQPKARKKVWSAIVLSMRGWLTLAYLHLVSGGTDNIPISEEQHVQYLTRYGITKQFKFSAVKGLTNEERARRLSWNYETGAPQDQILVGLARAFKTSWRYCITNMFRNIPEGDPAKVKFSYVEKYAVRDSIIYLAVLSLMLATFPLINNAAGDVPPPNEDDPKFLDDPYHYMKDIFIPNEYYKLMLADIYFRTIESSISSVDPTTALDFITSATVLYSAYKELAEFVQAMIDVAGFGDGTIHDTVNRGGYKHYTKFTRAFAKGTGFLDNIHTAFDFYGLDNNLKFYLGKYGGIYRFLGYDYKRKYGKDIIGPSYTPSMFGSKPSLGPKPSLGGKPSLGQKPKL